MEIYIQLPQPYATAVVEGIRNAVPIPGWPENRSGWVYIYATDSMIREDDIPLEWRQELFNHQQYGNLKPTAALPTNALVGFVKVLCKADPRLSMWSQDDGCTYHVVNPHEFDAPLYLPFEIVSRLERLNEYLPSHKRRISNPFMLNDTGFQLSVPVNSEVFSCAMKGGTIILEKVGTIGIILQEGMQDFAKLIVTHGDYAKSFFFDAELIDEYDENHIDKKLYPSAMDPSGLTTRTQILFSCRERWMRLDDW